MADEAYGAPLEFFETPREALRPLLLLLDAPRVVVDLGCGNGALGVALYEHFGAQSVGVEVLPARAELARAGKAYDAVITGDLSDYGTYLRLLAAAMDLDKRTRQASHGGGWLIIGNPPFAQWEMFGDRVVALHAFGGDNAEGEHQGALLLPAMAFEHRTRAAQHYGRTSLLTARLAGRYDLGARPKFWREFVAPNGDRYLAQKGTAPSSYAWWMYGAEHAGKWRWLEPDKPERST